ncbi:MAG: hypothetical protein Q8S73_12345 [Deltaproteobacteria bacterium]|nr:hypothetical protein [Myxococcales bacterium]MDP3214889.1 hypothetical protein [Deltaproteobacteria bacterium]
MRSLRWMLGLGLVLANCRSEGNNLPIETDSGAVDSGVVTDMGGVTVDQPSVSDACVRTGVENTPETCGDNIDNDCNGFTDCRDFSCSRNNPAVTFCPDAGTSPPRDGGACTRTGAEDTAAACTDGIDNDCDGFRDCADFDCPRATCPRDGGAPTDRPRCDSGGSRENTNAECNDGIDNDCDGFTDCVDFSCRTCAITVCVADGGITTPDGGVCLCQGAESSNATCGDGIDNDCDGFRDCADFDCSRSDGGVVTVCSDASAPADTGAATDLGAALDVPNG